MTKTRVAILFGGKSSEHEVSLVSATSVLNNLDPAKYDILMVGITREGDWVLYEGAIDKIAEASWEKLGPNTVYVQPVPSPKSHAFMILRPGKAPETVSLDVCFPVLHGAFGEDGTMQGLLALCGIPVVGCGCLASGLCMDKAMAKAVLNEAGVPQARAVILKKADYLENPEAYTVKMEQLGYPLFVKPSCAGSSVGVSKVKSKEQLAQAIEKAFKEDRKVLVEECIVGKEVEVAVLEENNRYTVSEPAEIVPGADFYDYEAKYISDSSSFFIPARLDDSVLQKVRKQAEFVFRTLDCAGFSRVDFFVTPDNRIILNEVNTIPGFTSISMYPKLMTRQSMTYSQLVDRLIASAINHFKN